MREQEVTCTTANKARPVGQNNKCSLLETQKQVLPDLAQHLTFRVRNLGSESLNLYQMDLRMDAKGVTPMPAPTSMLTS